jgi:hypothetical protein
MDAGQELFHVAQGPSAEIERYEHSKSCGSCCRTVELADVGMWGRGQFGWWNAAANDLRIDSELG